MKRYLLFALSFTSSIFCVAQENPLDFYADVMVNAIEGKHRAFASVQFEKALLEKLNSENSFFDPLANVEQISKLYAADSSFRVITYQVKINDNTFESHGYIQTKNGSLITLKNKSDEMEDIEYLSLDQDNWFGALYYEMMEVQINGKINYLLFGYDGYSKYDHRKVLEVITDVTDDSVVFGNEIFIIEKEGERPDRKQRLLIKYSGASNVTLNYDEALDMIVHPHLISRMGTIPGQGVTNVSDGSLVGYKLEEDGLWHFVEKIYDYISEEAPRPVPVLDGNQKDTDIMGKDIEKKKKKKRNK